MPPAASIEPTLMGNCFSSKSDTASLRDLSNRPGEDDPPITANQILKGLEVVASALHKQLAGQSSTTIIAVGGAINTVLLRTRHSTLDVDFFGLDKRLPPGLVDASEAAAKAIGLAKGWLNNHTALFIRSEQIDALFQEAVNDNVVLFQKPGLNVLVAPWRYCLVTKLNKAGKPLAKPYDIEDAAAYLYKLVEKRDGTAVTKTELHNWAGEFKCDILDTIIDKLVTEYRTVYGEEGILE